MSGTVPQSYLGTTIDLAVIVNHDHCDWTSDKLATMAKALQLSRMRIGGTEGDFTFYNLSDYSDGRGSSIPFPFRKLITATNLLNVLSFVNRTKFTIFMGLNAGWGKGIRDLPSEHPNATSFPWQPDSARSLLSFIVEQGFGDLVEGFEFSNEPNLFPFGKMSQFGSGHWAQYLTGSQFANDVQVAKTLLRSFRSDWKLLCCDVAYVPLFGEIDEFMKSFFSAGGASHIDMLTWHFYPLLAGSYNKTIPPALDPFYAAPSKVLQPFILDQVGYWASRLVEDFKNNAPANSTLPPVWLGETGSAVGGGANGLSNRFADVFEYFDKIGQMTLMGEAQIFRQTLCGSPDQYYGLINHTIDPRPSYFATLLLSRTVFEAGAGSDSVTILNVTRSMAPPVWGLEEHTRLYGFCRQGATQGQSKWTFLFLNLATTTGLGNMTIPFASNLNLTLGRAWALSGSPDPSSAPTEVALTSESLYVNGVGPLAVDPTGNLVQPFDSWGTSASESGLASIAQTSPSGPYRLEYQLPPLTTTLIEMISNSHSCLVV